MYRSAGIIIGFIICSRIPALAGDDVTGTIRDASTREILPYATVTLAGSRLGVISDAGGTFRMELPESSGADTIVISYMGYRTQRLSAASLRKNQTIYLVPYVFSIEEVVITPLEAESILRRAYDDFYKNHVHRDMATYGYYREQIFEEDRCVRYGEAVFATRFYEKDGKDMAAIEPYMGRSIDDSTFLKKLNGLFNKRRMLIPVGMDAYQDNNMISDFRVEKYYEWVGEFFFGGARNGFNVDYFLRENYIQDGRECYFITFEVHKKRTHIATGNILIDMETYGIAAFEIQFREQENLTRMILPAKIRFILKVMGYGVHLEDYEARLYNHYEDGRWYIGQGMHILTGGIAKRREWINGRIVNEFYAYYSKGYKAPAEQIEFRDIRVSDFDPAFWEDYRYAPIQPEQQRYIREIIRRNASFEGEVLSKRVRDKIAAQESKE